MRGFRLEPSEVTATLLRHEGVREAVTVVHHDDRTGPRLLSFVAAEADVTESDLRAFLAERLPRQARPSSISILSALPLTDNGEVAVAKLWAPAASAYVAPRNSAEADLAIVWADLLGVERVGILDDFFELGGHSLLLSQLATRIAEQFGTEIELQELFEAGTVEAMADRVIRAQLHALDEQEAADLLADVRGLPADGAALRKGDDGAGSAS